MTARPCHLCRARAGHHFHWCPSVGGRGRHVAPPVPAGTAHLPHHQVPESGTAVTGVPVVECTSAVLCAECLGDWCEACNHTGLALPSDWTAPALEPLGGVVGEAPAAEADDLAAAVARWCTDTLTRKEAA